MSNEKKGETATSFDRALIDLEIAYKFQERRADFFCDKYLELCARYQLPVEIMPELT